MCNIPPNMFSYRSVRTYDDLLHLNVEFIQGRLPMTPYHCGPLNDETLPMVEDLVRLHAFGFLSISSQPARMDAEPVFVPRTWLSNGKLCGNWWVQLKQRPFIEGYMELELLGAFGRFMETKSAEYLYSVYTISEEEYLECLCWGRLYSEMRLHLIETTFPTPVYALTQDRCHTSKSRLLAESWDTYTIYSKTGIPFDFDRYPNIRAIFLKGRPMMKVFIAGKRFGEGAVEKLLLEFFNTH